jgi:transposase
MAGLPRGQRYPDELRERGVRMVFEHQGEYSSQWKAITSIAEKLDGSSGEGAPAGSR